MGYYDLDGIATHHAFCVTAESTALFGGAIAMGRERHRLTFLSIFALAKVNGRIAN